MFLTRTLLGQAARVYLATPIGAFCFYCYFFVIRPRETEKRGKQLKQTFFFNLCEMTLLTAQF